MQFYIDCLSMLGPGISHGNVSENGSHSPAEKDGCIFLHVNKILSLPSISTAKTSLARGAESSEALRSPTPFQGHALLARGDWHGNDGFGRPNHEPTYLLRLLSYQGIYLHRMKVFVQRQTALLESRACSSRSSSSG